MSDVVVNLLGRKELSVTLVDGKTETVEVRALPLRKIVKYVEALEDEAQLVELLCDKPEGWADCLSIESHEAIVEEGNKINFPTAERWLQRRGNVVTLLAPMAAKVSAIQNLSPQFAPKRG